MSSVRDLISGAMRLIGAVDANSPLTDNEAADGLYALNGLLETLSLESLIVYQIVQEDLTLTGAASYTIGTGGTWNTTRPVKIEAAKYLVGTQEWDLAILTDQEWQAIEQRSLGGFPEAVHMDGAFPLATVSIWPVPTTDKLRLFSWKPLTAFSAVTDALSLPPGYERMLRYNLAVELAPEFSKEPPAAVVTTAIGAKAALKRNNSEPLYLACDDALLGGHTGYSRSDFLGGK